LTGTNERFSSSGHAIDGMHLQKNVFDNTAGLLGILGKVKDGLKSRKDLVAL